MATVPHTNVASKPKPGQLPGFLKGGGEMATLIAKFPWSKTELGDIDLWPQNLRTTVNIMLQSAVPIAVLWGADGIMLYNKAYSVIAGKRHPSVLGCKVAEGWPEIAEFNNVLKQVLSGKTLSYENQQLTLHRNSKPEEVWLNLNYNPVMDESGIPVGVIAIVIETTSRILAEQKQRQAEQTLLTERKRFHDLIMNAPAVISIMHGPEHVYELANPGYMDVIGHREVIGKTFREAVPELEGQGVFETYDKVYQTGKRALGIEVPLMLDRKGTGVLEELYFNCVYQPFFDDNNNVEGVLVHAVDVTAQVMGRKAAEESEKRFRFMAETLPLKIFTADAVGKVTYLNPQWSEYFGLPVKQLLEERVLKHLHPDDVESSISTWQKSLESGAPFELEQRLRRSDGKFRRHVSNVRAMRDADGQVVSWFGSMTDIEDILQTAVDKQKFELMASGLKEQRSQLLAINKAKDEFIALSSHQLRTPATAVKSYVHMVMNGYFGPLNDEQTKYLQTAYDSNERQLNIINDLLKTAQIDSTSYVLSKTPESIQEIIRETISDLHPAAELKHQTIVFSGEIKTTTVLVDRHELKLALVNLLENAIKYSFEDTIITIKLQHKGSRMELSIADQGVGISPENSKRIFDKFTRIDNELSDTVNGTGLGLYWVKRIIKLHNGTIKIQSKPGIGSTFILSLPL